MFSLHILFLNWVESLHSSHSEILMCCLVSMALSPGSDEKCEMALPGCSCLWGIFYEWGRMPPPLLPPDQLLEICALLPILFSLYKWRWIAQTKLPTRGSSQQKPLQLGKPECVRTKAHVRHTTRVTPGSNGRCKILIFKGSASYF